MTEAANKNLPMPTTIELVRETLDSFAVDKTRSTAIDFDRPTLETLGAFIIDPQQPDSAGLQYLVDEFGEDAMSRSAYYRFALDFRERYSDIQQHHRAQVTKIAEAIGAAAGDRTDSLAQVLIHQVMRLAAERAVDTNDLAQLQGRELGAMLSLIDGWTKAGFKKQELQLKAEDAERKAAKLEADLREKEQKLSKLPDQVKRLAERIDDIEGATKRGRSIDPSVFAAIKAELLAMAPPPEASPETPPEEEAA